MSTDRGIAVDTSGRLSGMWLLVLALPLALVGLTAMGERTSAQRNPEDAVRVNSARP